MLILSLIDNVQTDIVLHAKSILRTELCRKVQDNIVVIMAGTNGYYSDEQDYVNQLAIAVKSIAGGKYLILSQFDVHWNDDGTYQTYKSAQLAKLDTLKKWRLRV